MKKIIVALFLFAGSFSIANAQTKEITKVQATPAVTATAKVKTTEATSATPDIQKSTVRPILKKDGTSDKRSIENKVKTKTTIVSPVKKDGTPDMRYKKNKAK